MFESDDYDQILSQFEFPDCQTNDTSTAKENRVGNGTEFTISTINNTSGSLRSNIETNSVIRNENEASQYNEPKQMLNRSPTQNKRKIIDTHFDYTSKRKFPGPAGLLTGTLEESRECVSHIELLSQDVDYSECHLKNSAFESPIWIKVLDDINKLALGELNTIENIKQQALAGNLPRRKAQTVLAFVESVDRSIVNPLISLRDDTGSIKCTLHRDAWDAFSNYITSEQCIKQCVLVLNRPTVLTTGTSYKKHYLNITLQNIFALYSTKIVQENEEKQLPDGYVKTDDDFTIIKTTNDSGSNSVPDSSLENIDFLDDLNNIFADDLF